MPDESEVAVHVRGELRAALDSFARGAQDLPGATVAINVETPLTLGPQVEERLRQDAAEVIRSLDRSWTPDLVFSDAPTIGVEVEYATAWRAPRSEVIPHISLEFPEDQSTRGLVRSQLDDSIVYSLAREASRDPVDGSRLLVLGSQHFPAEVFLRLRREGETIWVQAPRDFRVQATSPDAATAVPDSAPLQLDTDWRVLVSEAGADRASGRFEITRQGGGAPVTLDYNILGWGLEWNHRRQTRFRGITTNQVIVEKRVLPMAGRTKQSFVKVYECYTVHEAAALENHFRHQQEVIQSINRTAGVAALEEVEVWRGQPVRAAGTVTYYGTRLTSHSPASPSQPHLQADHRVFVARMWLESPDWATGGLTSLRELEPLARTLDLAHRQGAAHCDVKPENLLLKHPFDTPSSAVASTLAVLVDSEAFTQPNGRIPSTGLHTPPYAHPSFNPLDPESQPLEHLVANDRLGFVAITITGLFGPEVCSQVFGDPQPSSAGRRAALTDAAISGLPQVSAPRLTELLMAPLADESSKLAESTTSWSCEAWLSDVIAATAPASDSAELLSTQYPLEVEPVMSAIQTAFNRAAAFGKESAIEAALKEQVEREFWQRFRHGLGWGAATSAALAIVLVVVLVQAGAL